MAFEYGGDEPIQSIGEYLKRLRIQRELTLVEASEKTKIHAKFLAALEEDDDTALPDHVFKDLFLKSYADFLGVSVEEIMLRLPEPQAPVLEDEKAAPRPPKEGTVAPIRARSSPAPVVATIPVEDTSRGVGVRSAVIIGLLIVIAVLGYFLVKLVKETRQQAGVPVAVPVEPAPKKVKPALTDSSLMAADSADTNNIVAVPDSMYMLVVGRSHCWLSFRKDSDTGLVEDELRTDDTLWLTVQDSVLLKIGRANGVDVFFNALPLKLGAGADTSVVTVVLTRDNYKQYVDSSRLAP